jgi:lysozyme family protein
LRAGYGVRFARTILQHAQGKKTMSFDQSFENLLPWEGGFGDDPRDPGGATNLGIIQSEYSAFRQRKGLQTQSVRYITKGEAREIYLNEYWDRLSCGQFDPGVANALFDSGVNSGIGRGSLWLQQAINSVIGEVIVPENGTVGAATITKANQLHPGDIIDRLLAIRLAFDKRARNPNTGELLWPAFGGGWADRIVGVRKQSHALAGLPEPKPEPPFVIEIDFGQPLEKLTVGNFIFTILGNPQVQSLLRSALKLGGTALFVKAGLDPSTIDGFVGLLFTGVGLLQSAVVHSTPAPVPSSATQPAS